MLRRAPLADASADSSRFRSGPPASAATSTAGGSTPATRSGAARNSRSAARQLRQVCMWGRSVARSSALASPSASAERSGSYLAQSAPRWIPDTRRRNARRPSVRRRFTFVYDQPVIAQISRYENPSAFSTSARISCGFR